MHCLKTPSIVAVTAHEKFKVGVAERTTALFYTLRLDFSVECTLVPAALMGSARPQLELLKLTSKRVCHGCSQNSKFRAG
ncbi:hypothetical protein T265_11514 [Opisthorchis viverrini]|uniref:Uncharacterized protein n=1 Tax=Opisthorchis viverrini TaxID=6198 RepID=A0A074ZX83_OPIVI|nr:hypothetical protein T265_11514 [Opisthorchis viverrini]KER19794.1 hypothetical protein T265_11514 [Opisthorchis viverrini]